MATKRITVSVPVEVAARIKQAAGARHSVSEWVTNAVKRTLAEEDLERRFLDFCDAVPATRAEEAQAKASFDTITRAAKRPSGKRARREARRGKAAA